MSPEPVALRLDQLWQHLPSEKQQAIAATLGQMAVRQITATSSSPSTRKEASDE